MPMPSGNRGGADGGGDSEHTLDDTGQTVESAIFSVVHTLGKEKYDTMSSKYSLFKIAVEFLQLFLLIVQPSMGWHINEELW